MKNIQCTPIHLSRFVATVAAVVGLVGMSAVRAADTAMLTVHLDQPAAKIGPLFNGIMNEEINHSHDGGLYAELIQNRIFQDDQSPVHWSVVNGSNGAGTIAIDETNPVNSKALRRSLRLSITDADAQRPVGVANEGYWGVPIYPNTTYHASFYARADADLPLTVSIDGKGGPVAMATVQTVGRDWKKYQCVLKTGDVEKANVGKFVISTTGKGTLWLSLVSLFPPTYNDRPNGNRIDLMQKLADLHPKFLRFPGGTAIKGVSSPIASNGKKPSGRSRSVPVMRAGGGIAPRTGSGFSNICSGAKT